MRSWRLLPHSKPSYSCQRGLGQDSHVPFDRISGRRKGFPRTSLMAVGHLGLEARNQCDDTLRRLSQQEAQQEDFGLWL